MTMGAARLVVAGEGWRIDRQPGPDLAAHLAGRPVAEAAALLPRLFNLCRMAQGTAARLTLGLPVSGEDTGAEVIRDHMARLHVTLRQAFGLSPRPLPAATPDLFGPSATLPQNLSGLRDWLAQDHPLAELGRAVQAAFPPGHAVTPALPQPAPLLSPAENSAAGRQAQHPLMQALEQAGGRGPLCRYIGILADLAAAMTGALPPPRLLADGTAVVQAARGHYFLRIGQTAGRVTTLARLTPTDHQLAPGGALDHALRGLPPGLAPRLVALIDPCVPVTIAEACHA